MIVLMSYLFPNPSIPKEVNSVQCDRRTTHHSEIDCIGWVPDLHEIVEDKPSRDQTVTAKRAAMVRLCRSRSEGKWDAIETVRDHSYRITYGVPSGQWFHGLKNREPDLNLARFSSKMGNLKNMHQKPEISGSTIKTTLNPACKKNNSGITDAVTNVFAERARGVKNSAVQGFNKNEKKQLQIQKI